MTRNHPIKILWYGSDRDAEGNPVIPEISPDFAGRKDGINYGELYIFNSDDNPSIYIRTDKDRVVPISGGGGDLSILNRLFSALDKDGNVIDVKDKTTPIASIRANYGLWGVDYVSAKGISEGGGGAGLITGLYRFSDLGGTFDNSANDTFNAYTINEIWKLAKEGGGGGIKNLTVTGEGNAVTDIALAPDNAGLVVTKGKSFFEKSLTVTGTGNAVTGLEISGDGIKATKGKEFLEKSVWDDFMQGTDADNIINKWAELEVFLQGMKETDNLATILSNKVDKQGLNRLFTALDASGNAVDINDMTKTIVSIRANFGFWGVDYVSAKGVSQGGSGSGGALYQLSDVLPNADNNGVLDAVKGSALVFDGTHWKAGTAGVDMDALTWANISGKPTTLLGYGITDAYTKAEADNFYHSSGVSNLNVGMSGNVVTLDYNNPTGGFGGWINVFKSTHHGYLHSYIANLHRTSDWRLGYVDTHAENPAVSWVKILHSGNYTQFVNPADYVTAIGVSGNYVTWTKNGAVNSLTVPYATRTLVLNNNGRKEAISGTTLGEDGLRLNQVYNNGYPTAFGNLLRIGGVGYGELLCGWSGAEAGVTASLYYRSKRDVASTPWGAWNTILDSSNYSGILDGRYVTLGTNQTITGAKTFTQSIVQDNANCMIFSYGTGKGVLLRQDGSDFWFLISDNGTANFNSYRPLQFNLGNGNVRMAHNVTIGGEYAPTEKLDVNGNALIKGVLKIGGNDTLNYLTFRGTTSDGAGSFNHTWIAERKWGGSESSELVLFKGNDMNGDTILDPIGAGPDRIRHIASGHLFQVYTSALSGDPNTVCDSTALKNVFSVTNSLVTSYVRAKAESLQIGNGLLRWDSTNNALYVTKADGTTAGFYASGFVTAKGVGSGGTQAQSLAGLSDVTITNPAANNALVYNASSGKWENKPFSAGLDSAMMWTELSTPNASKKIDVSHIPTAGLNADMLDGLHENKFLRYRDSTNAAGAETLWSQIGIRQYNGVYPDGMTIHTYHYGQVVSLSAIYCRLEIWSNHHSSDPGQTANGLQYRTGWDNSKFTWRMLLDNVNGPSYLGLGNYMKFQRGDFDPNTLYGIGVRETAVNTNAPTTGVWHQYMNWGTGDSRFTFQMANEYDNIGNLYFRQKVSDSWGAWRTVLDSVNYTSVLDGRYVNVSGDTMTGPLNLKNSTWNAVGDDAFFGDCDIAGGVGIKPNNSDNPSIVFFHQNGTNLGALAANGTTLQWQGYKLWHAGNDGSGSGLDADLLDGHHEGYFVNCNGVHFTQYNNGSWMKVLTFTINSGSLYPSISFTHYPTECNRERWVDFMINIRSNNIIFYKVLKGFGNVEMKCVGDGTTFSVWMQCNKAAYDGYGVIIHKAKYGINTYTYGRLAFQDSEPTGTYEKWALLSGQSDYANGSGWATKLQTARTFWINDPSGANYNNYSFDGTGNVDMYLPATMTGFSSITSTNLEVTNINRAAGRLRIGMSISDGGDTPWYGISFISDQNEPVTMSGYFGLKFRTGSGILRILRNGNAGIGTDSPSQRLEVNGNIKSGSIYTSDWFRSTGKTGWYSQDYGGGWYMEDTTWIRNWNNKPLLLSYTEFDALRLNRNADNKGAGISFYTKGTYKGDIVVTANSWFSFSTTGGDNVVEISPSGGLHSKAEITAKASGSDIRLKKDIAPFSGLDIIRRFRSITYHWNDTAKANSKVYDNDFSQYGLVAQDLLAGGFPQWVKDVFHDYYTIDYERLIPVLWRGVQETDDEVTTLKRKVRDLETEVKRLKRQIQYG